MIVPALSPYRRRRGRPKRAATVPPTPPPPLTLVSAFYDELELILVLQFDRPVTVGALQPQEMTVDDGQFNNAHYVASYGSLLDPVTVRMTLEQEGPYTESSAELLSASALTGIQAVDDGGTWPGVTNLPLQYP